jgi:anti-sigma factor RsiW
MREPTCREVVEIVTGYIEGTMAPEEREALELHLAGCKGCRAYVEQMRAVIGLAGASAPEAIPAELGASLLKAFRGFERGSP